MEKRGAETRSAFLFFALSTICYIFSAGAYAWLMKTPEYREIEGGHVTRRISISMSQYDGPQVTKTTVRPLPLPKRQYGA